VKVLVVGGGIIGCASALELAKAGCDVTLVERAAPGAEASSAAAGMLAPLGESSARSFRDLAVASWRLYPAVVDELRARTGVDVEYVTRGTIYPLFRTPDESEARGWALGEEFGAEVLDAKEVHAREPALSPRVRGGIFVRGDHWVNNQRLVLAYAQAAVAAGVELLTGSAVSRLVVEGSRVRGAVADGQPLAADQVLLAAGAWTAELLASIGLHLPLEPRRGQMLALAHVPAVVTHCVHGEVYLVPRPSGELLVGATVERAGFQRAVTAEGVAGLLRGALDLVPSVAELPIARTWCGFRPWASDALPVLGPWPGVPGLWVATAHFRNGILLGPITARLMTEWLVQGRPSLDLQEFLPDRFARGGKP
jgi:glycine oxidase